jgi:MFS family permease
MLLGLVAGALLLPIMNAPTEWRSMTVSMVVVFGALGLIVTPSLTYMAEAASTAGLGSFGVVYGLYNVAWGVGLLFGPSTGGLVLQHLGFPVLTLSWAAGLFCAALLVRRA